MSLQLVLNVVVAKIQLEEFLLTFNTVLHKTWFEGVLTSCMFTQQTP